MIVMETLVILVGEVTVRNVGDVASRNALFLQLEYDRLRSCQSEGVNFRINPVLPDTYYHFEDIGILYTSNQNCGSW